MMHYNTDVNIAQGQGILLPAKELQDLVQYIWYYSGELMQRPSHRFRIIPSGSTGLIFQHFRGKPSVCMENGQNYPLAFLHGQDIKPVINIDYNDSSLVSFRFKSTTLKKLFKLDANELTNQVVPLDYVARYNITEQLLNCNDIFEAIDLITQFLMKKAHEKYKEDLIIEESVQNIQNNILTITPSQLQKVFSISERQFQRRFRSNIGISLETYIRVIKFQRSIHLIKQNQFNKLSDIAYDLGYTDQSHFIRDFKTFSGMTPNEAYKHLRQPEFSPPNILTNKFRITRFIYEKVNE
jgi:AraC-like DNA-binding protein